uniref:C6 domain-containing protein n=1 Tax=Plectus sambesii TaxID=2011161 RepID=A0A914V5L4_9BILA
MSAQRLTSPLLVGVVLSTTLLVLNLAVYETDACAATVTTPSTCACPSLDSLPYIGFVGGTLDNPLSFTTPSENFGEACEPTTITCNVLPASAADEIDFFYGSDFDNPVAVSPTAASGSSVSVDVTCNSAGYWTYNGARFDKLSC